LWYIAADRPPCPILQLSPNVAAELELLHPGTYSAYASRSVLKQLCQLDATTAIYRNHARRLPLHLTISHGKPWWDGIDVLLQAHPHHGRARSRHLPATALVGDYFTPMQSDGRLGNASEPTRSLVAATVRRTVDNSNRSPNRLRLLLAANVTRQRPRSISSTFIDGAAGSDFVEKRQRVPGRW
jgi:hypothetical protein